MMVKVTPLENLRVAGTIYDFAEVQDELAIHTHTRPAENHITVVARGSVKVIGDAPHAGRILHAGDVADWPLGVAHGFVALEPNARIVNIRKSG